MVSNHGGRQLDGVLATVSSYHLLSTFFPLHCCLHEHTHRHTHTLPLSIIPCLLLFSDSCGYLRGLVSSMRVTCSVDWRSQETSRCPPHFEECQNPGRYLGLNMNGSGVGTCNLGWSRGPEWGHWSSHKVCVIHGVVSNDHVVQGTLHGGSSALRYSPTGPDQRAHSRWWPFLARFTTQPTLHPARTWVWGEAQWQSFKQIKDTLPKSPVLALLTQTLKL